MTAEYPAAQWAAIPGFGFPQGSHNGNHPKFIILHGTASGDGTAQQQVRFFQGTNQHGVHFVIGKDGTVFQMVLLADAAYGNCCIDVAKHDAFWDTVLRSFSNLNTCTISIEHCKTSTSNADILTQAQQAASFALVKWLCARLNIPARAADVNGGITGHYSINGINRADCPGPYPWTALWAYLGGKMVPTGWSDDGMTLHAPNGVTVIHGFRDYILSHLWDEGNAPLAAEYTTSSVEPLVNPATGAGARQDFHECGLGWTAARGVFPLWVGDEIAALQKALAAVPPPAPPVPPGPVSDPLADTAKAALRAWLNS